MGTTILIAGSGRIAEDIGVYFLKRNNAVSWVSRTESCLVDLQGRVNVAVQTFLAQSHGSVRSLSAGFYLYDELEDDAFDIVIECSSETAADKKDVMSRLGRRIRKENILLSTTLSVPLSEIHPDCIGFRIAYPLETEKSVQVNFPAPIDESKKQAIRSFCEANHIKLTA